MTQERERRRKQRLLARNMREQCVIQMGAKFKYRCQLVQGHPGRHIDYRGEEWLRSEGR